MPPGMANMNPAMMQQQMQQMQQMMNQQGGGGNGGGGPQDPVHAAILDRHARLSPGFAGDETPAASRARRQL